MSLVRFAILGCLLAATAATGQDPPKPAKDKDAIKLPDGTIVFYTKSPDDANPPVDGVRLSAKEYKALVDQAEQLKKQRDGAKPAGPSECRVAAKVVTRGDRSVAELTLTYQFRTTLPRQSVALGGGHAFPTGAKIDGDKLPVLVSADDGFTVLIEQPGDHTLTLSADAPVTPRGFTGANGFDVGLPRAAITSLTFESPFPAGTKDKRVTVGVRGADPAVRPGEFHRTTYDAAGPVRPVPLGPADHLEVIWDAPTGGGSSSTAVVAESEIAVRFDDTQVETTAKVKLKGDSARTWSLVLPHGAHVGVDRGGTTRSDATGTQPTVTKPADRPGPGRWTVDLPDAGDWVLTAVVRTPRGKPGSPESAGPFPVGPFAVRNVLRQTGTVRVTGPPNVQFGFTHGSELRRSDPIGEDVATFHFHTVPVGPGDAYPPLAEITATHSLGVVLVRPQYRFRLTQAGWRVHADVHVTPIRTTVAHLRFEYPAEWPLAELGPPELAERSTADPPGPRKGTIIRFDPPRHEPFDFTIDATLPVTGRTAAVTLPQFIETSVRESVVNVVLPSGFDVRGSVRPAAPGADAAVDLMPNTTNTVTATIPGPAGRVDLAWLPHRTDLAADVRADVSFQDRQYVVTETIEFRAPEAFNRPVRLRGPTGVAGLRGQPILTPAGPGEWTVAPAGEPAKEFTLVLSYAIAGKPDPGSRLPVGLIWPDDATRTDVTVRVWSGADQRVAGFDGPWRQAPPSPSPNRDSLPGLTLQATRGPDDPAPPLTILPTETDAPLSRAAIERSVVQVWFPGDGPGLGRARLLLSRWPAAGVDLDLPDPAVEILLDGKRVEALPPLAPADGFAAAVRVPMPDPKPGRPPVLLEVRFPLAKSDWVQTVQAPHVRAAVLRTPSRWQISPAPGSVILDTAGSLSAETRWSFRGSRFVPSPVGSSADLDRWIADGTESNTESDESGILGRQIDPYRPVRLTTLPATPWSIGCSAVVVLVGLILSRMKSGLGYAVGVVGAVLAVAYLGFPQPAGEFVAAAEPGLAAVAVAAGAYAAVHWYYRRQIAHLPGFSRVPADDPTQLGPAAKEAA
jgi:hypothetical protein